MLSVFTKTNYTLGRCTTSYNLTKTLVNQFRALSSLTLSNNNDSSTSEGCLSKLYSPSIQPVRHHVSGFLNKYPAQQLWKSVSSVSPAGRKRGRAKTRGKKIIKDLNKGQVLGIGTENIRWPGLSAPILRGQQLMQREKLPPDEKYRENLIKLQEKVMKARREKISPLDRGWTGGHPEGRKIGPPDPVEDYKFEGFETVILDQKPILRMTRHFGRYRTVSAICATGNGKGLVGYSLVHAPEAKAALRQARNRSSQKLMYIPRYDERTIVHNFYSRFCNTKIYAWKQSPGYGLNCHRILKSLCELIGIKDLYAVVEGGKAPLNIIQAFLLGLLRQKSFEELSNETNLHVVEMSRETDYFPKLLSSPENPIDYLEETPTFELYLFDNQMFRKPIRETKHFERYRTYPITLRKMEKLRSHLDTNLELRARYGEIKSFLTDKYPECSLVPAPWTRKWNLPQGSNVEKNEVNEN